MLKRAFSMLQSLSPKVCKIDYLREFFANGMGQGRFSLVCLLPEKQLQKLVEPHFFPLASLT
jgi:hypothetical protein